METKLIIEQLRKQAEQIANKGYYGWGNTMIIAAEEIEKLEKDKKEMTDFIMKTVGKEG